MAALPEYKFGKVEDTVPDLRVISERSESPMVCCGYCSAHMAASTAKAGLSTDMNKEAHAIRRAGGRAHNAGNTATELREGTAKALGVVLKSVAIIDITQRLKDGFAVTAGIQYARLPSWLKVQQNDFGHAVCLFGYDAPTNRVGMFDPLWQQGARGAWVPWVSMREALWPNGNHSTTTVRMVAMAGDYVIYDDVVETRKTGAIAKGTPFFNDWKMTDKRGAIAGDGNRFRIYGYRGDAYAVRVSTTQGWSGDDAKPTLVFVAKTKVTSIQTAPEPVPPTTDEDCDDEITAVVMQRDAEWEEALKHGEPWPSQPSSRRSRGTD